MPLLTALIPQPPVVPAAIHLLYTHELRIGSEIVNRDGTSTLVSAIGNDGPRILVQLTDGRADEYRRRRLWRVIAPASEALPA